MDLGLKQNKSLNHEGLEEIASSLKLLAMTGGKSTRGVTFDIGHFEKAGVKTTPAFIVSGHRRPLKIEIIYLYYKPAKSCFFGKV